MGREGTPEIVVWQQPPLRRGESGNAEKKKKSGQRRNKEQNKKDLEEVSQRETKV